MRIAERKGSHAHKINFEIPLAEIKFGGEIGKGSFGAVRAGFWRGTEVAIKTASVAKDEQKQAFIKEAQLMCSLRPHVRATLLYFGSS